MEDLPGGERRRAGWAGALAAALATALATVAIGAIGVAQAARAQASLCSQPVAESLSQIGLQPVAESPNQPWAQRQLDPARVWPLTTGAGVTVAVIDSGVDAGYPALKGAVEQGADLVQPGQPADYDCVGHGTLVAGIIAARPRPGTGFVGIAPGATILPVRQTESDQQQPNGAGILAQAIDYAVSRGAQVINISITTSGTTPALADAVRRALDHDVVIVAAAGNDGASPYTAKEYPADYPGVLAVGAVGQDGQPLSFSSPGAAVVAPGTDIVGPDAAGTGLVAGEGTSFATAFVSGVAALVRSYLPALTAAQVVNRIEATADHPAGPLPSALLGWGEVDPYAAVTAVLPGRPSAAPAPARLPVPPRPRPSPSQLPALLTAAISLTVIAVVLAAATVFPAARRRGWRPGTLVLIPNGSGVSAPDRSDSARHLNQPRAEPPAVQDAAPGGLPPGGDGAEQRPLLRTAGQHDPARP